MSLSNIQQRVWMVLASLIAFQFGIPVWYLLYVDLFCNHQTLLKTRMLYRCVEQVLTFSPACSQTIFFFNFWSTIFYFPPSSASLFQRQMWARLLVMNTVKTGYEHSSKKKMKEVSMISECLPSCNHCLCVNCRPTWIQMWFLPGSLELKAKARAASPASQAGSSSTSVCLLWIRYTSALQTSNRIQD